MKILFTLLTAVLNQYGIVEIKRLGLDIWSGCLNVRKKRGATKWSTHSWGIALYYNPEQNALRWGRERAVFAKPEYNKWWKIWEKEGWVMEGEKIMTGCIYRLQKLFNNPLPKLIICKK